MAHPQQALLDSLNDDDRIEVKWGISHRAHEVPVMASPKVQTARNLIRSDDLITAVYRRVVPQCPHLTLRSHVEGGYICATDGFPQCHQKFDALPSASGVKEARVKFEDDDLDGTKLQEKLAKLLAELNGYDWDHRENRDQRPGYMRDAEVILELVTTELGV